MERRGTVVLLSGGLDSCVATAYAVEAWPPVKCALWFAYGQRHRKEWHHAQLIADHYHIPLRVIDVDLRWMTPGEVGHLLKPDFDPEAAHSTVEDQFGHNVSATFVPGRNIIFLAYAAALADAEGLTDIVGGMNAVDFSGYPDCRPEFIRHMETAISNGLRHSVNIRTPLISLKKSEIIRLGKALNAPMHLTWSCYAGGEKPCGKCPSCVIRAKGFAEADLPDPALV
jgi:7-cyano-7-deazaguanine synthase